VKHGKRLTAEFRSGRLEMVDPIADKFVLLLSTDWFFPYWPCLGLYVSPKEKAQIQRALREEIQRSFLGKTYWRASFESARVESTYRALFEAFKRAGRDTTADALAALTEKRATGAESNRDAWLLATMTEMLADSGDRYLSSDLVDAVQKAWQLSRTGTVNLGTLCEQSSTEWDVAIRALTPDLPDWLATFLSTEIQLTDQFGIFWSEFQHTASASQIEELKQWYRATSHALTGEYVDPNGVV
jgi:hypothetical protein